jgi:ribonucleoside-diphosphate reductase alpha chain
MSEADQSSPAAASVRAYKYQDSAITIMIDDARDELLTEFGKATLTDRYLLPGERFQDMFARVACANSDEILFGQGNGHAQRLYDYISKLWFMPATPVLTNSGVKRGLPISCFLNLVGDSMESIAEAVTENIWLAAKGGGIGTCWSPVRSINEPIAGSLTGKTSGIVPFIHWQDAQTLAISQGSLRRGSAAVYLDVSHPEVEEFIDIRRPTGGDQRRKAHNIHHGIMISDAFMQKVLAEDGNHDWELKSPKTGEIIKTVNARDLWIKMLVTRLETGEPYLVFADNVNRNIPAVYEALGLFCQQSNLCSEITLHTGPDHLNNWRTAVCCLSSLNMETMDQWFENTLFVGDVMRFLDNVLQQFIDNSANYPGFERARYAAERERSVGLGIMGFHSYLQSKEIPFESVAAQKVNKELWQWLAQVAALENQAMAGERGACPDSIDAHELNPELPLVRLTHVFSIAPTASISIIAGGASPCGEPQPANSYNQKTLSGSFNVRNRYLDAQLRRRYKQLQSSLERMNKTVRFMLKEQPIFADMDLDEEAWVEKQWQSITINDGSVQHLPYLCSAEKGIYRTAFEMDQRWVVIHHADRAPFVCQAQSVNIFLPATVHKRDLHEVHKLAWEKGLKSLYYLRSRTASKAMAVTNVAGEMPTAQIDGVCPMPAGPMYLDEPECLSCQ